jgi:hypothetical protein
MLTILPVHLQNVTSYAICEKPLLGARLVTGLGARLGPGFGAGPRVSTVGAGPAGSGAAGPGPTAPTATASGARITETQRVKLTPLLFFDVIPLMYQVPTV